MRKFLALTMVGLMLTVIFASCATNGHNCEAYGKAPAAEQVDLAE